MNARDRLASVPFRRIVWLLPLALCLHELDEWNIHAWQPGFFENPSVVSATATRIVLLLVSVAGLLGTAAACALPSVRATAAVSITGFAVVMVGNGIQHLYWTYLSGQCTPGTLTSGLVCFPAMAVVVWHALRNGLIGRSFVAGLAFVWAAMFVGIVQMGRTAPAAFHALHALGSRIGTLVGMGE